VKKKAAPFQPPAGESSLSRFVHKTSKNRLKGDSLPRKLPRGSSRAAHKLWFSALCAAKTNKRNVNQDFLHKGVPEAHRAKNPQVRQARIPI
jgi:hypothetical protein